MKFLRTLLEDHDDDIFDDLLDDLSVQTLMGDIAQAVNDGTPWAQIAKNKHKYEDAAQTDVTNDEWNVIIRVLKAGGRYAKMVGLNEMHHEYEEDEVQCECGSKDVYKYDIEDEDNPGRVGYECNKCGEGWEY